MIERRKVDRRVRVLPDGRRTYVDQRKRERRQPPQSHYGQVRDKPLEAATRNPELPNQPFPLPQSCRDPSMCSSAQKCLRGCEPTEGGA